MWKPTNHRFRGACNYRAYRLVDTDPTVNAKVYATTRKRVQYLLVVMGEHTFSWYDPVKVICFLARCKENFDNAEMSEAMALIALPHLLNPPAKGAYESHREYFRRNPGIASWPAAVNWLLRTYATNIQIEQALSVVWDLRQKPGEVETEYTTRMLTALARCEDIHSPYERRTLFIEGLLPAIKPLVLQARENRHRSSVEDTVAQAGAQGAAYRVQTAGARRRVDFANPTPKQVVSMADSMPSSTSAGMTPSYRTGLDAENFLADDEAYAAAAGSPSFPSEESSFNEKESLFYRERRPTYK